MRGGGDAEVEAALRGERAVLAASLLLFAAFLLMFRRKNTCGEGESGIK